MEKSAFKCPIIATAIIGLGTCALAQDLDAGKTEFLSSCAACHGADGKGNGPMSAALTVDPSDLTVLAKKNNGVFPVNAVYEIIDGRKSLKAHGMREMPVWGFRYMPSPNQALSPTPAGKYLDLSYNPEVAARSRVLAIVDYLNRIQEK